ncbi:MAG TPA: hypothetical protein VHK90_00160 [Thermoanaerobaculia bacterium]|nr:hypothetical protein [Thermoanaerobaculia bacterium]
MSAFAPKGLDTKGDDRQSEHRAGNPAGSIGEALQRRPAVQAIFQLKQVLAAGPASGGVVQRATDRELGEALATFNDIKTRLKDLHTLSAGELSAVIAEMYDFVRYVAQDTDHETERQAYSGIYVYVDRLIDRIHGRPGADALIDRYLAPILDILRRASMVARGERRSYAETLPEIDPDGAGLETVIAQAAYMSGDMFGVGAALRLDPRLGVAIFYDHLKNHDREIEDKLLAFYQDKQGRDHPRVALIPVGDSQLAYKKAVAGDFSDRRLFPSGKPRILSNVENASTIGNATRIVARAYAQDPGVAREALEEEWLPEGAREGTARGGSRKSIAEWVAEKGIHKGVSYAFIWFRRSGAKGGAHRELDTSETATSQIIQTTRGTAADQIVLIGDSGYTGEARPDINLTEFWNEPGSPFHGSGRKMQLALFSYLKHSGFNIMNVGMRSGALEGPALLGIKTVFLEEKYNLQEGRMDQWQGVVPGFKRVELEHVPTKAGKEELQRLIALTAASNRDDYRNAIDRLTDLLGRALDARPPNLDRIIAERAGAGIDSTRGLYDPNGVDDVFRFVVRDIGDKIGRKTSTTLGDAWPEFRRELRGAIRAYQEWSKALVKDHLAGSYSGPEEGLSETDQNKLWDAIGMDVGGWQKTGGSKSRKGYRK